MFWLYGNEIPDRRKCSKLWNFKNFVIELWKRLRLNHHPESNQTRIEAEKWNYRKHPFHYQDKTSWNIFRKSNNFWKMIPNLEKILRLSTSRLLSEFWKIFWNITPYVFTLQTIYKPSLKYGTTLFWLSRGFDKVVVVHRLMNSHKTNRYEQDRTSTNEFEPL